MTTKTLTPKTRRRKAAYTPPQTVAVVSMVDQRIEVAGQTIRLYTGELKSLAFPVAMSLVESGDAVLARKSDMPRPV